MGLSNMLQGGSGGGGADAGATAAPATGGDAATAPQHKSFGDKLGDYFKSRYPIAGGLAGMVFDPNGQQAPTAQPASAPLAAMPNNSQPDYSSLIAQNAQPQQGGGGLA